MSSLTTHLASLTASTLGGVLPWSQQQQDDASLLSPDCPEEEEGDDDDAEPMLSGFGDVSKDCRYLWDMIKTLGLLLRTSLFLGTMNWGSGKSC